MKIKYFIMILVLFCMPILNSCNPSTDIKSEVNYEKSYELCYLNIEQIILNMDTITPIGDKINDPDIIYVLSSNAQSSENANKLQNIEEPPPIYRENNNDYRFIYTDIIENYSKTTQFLYPSVYKNLNIYENYKSNPITTNGYLAMQYTNDDKENEIGYTLHIGNPYNPMDELIKNNNSGDIILTNISSTNNPALSPKEYVKRSNNYVETLTNNFVLIEDIENQENLIKYDVNYLDTETKTIGNHNVKYTKYNYANKVAGIKITFSYENIYYTIITEIKN